MRLYEIRDWQSIYENNRTRDLKHMAWVPIPNDLDGDGYTLLIEREDGPALFGAWIACVEVASRCDPRGTLLRRGGEPHNAASLSRITRIPASIIERMIEVAESECKWLISKDFVQGAETPQERATIPHDPARNRTEQKGTEGTEPNGTAGPAVELPNGFPATEAQAISAASNVGAPDEFVAREWLNAMSRGGKDSRGVLILSWPHYIAKVLSYERDRKAAAGSSSKESQSTGVKAKILTFS